MKTTYSLVIIVFLVFGCRFTASDRESVPDQGQDGIPERPGPESPWEAPENFPFFTPKTAKSAINKSFQALLHRDAEQTEIDLTEKTLTTQHVYGWAQVLEDLVFSNEFKTEIETRFTHLEILTQIYRGLLGRDVDPVGTSTFLPLISAGKINEAVRTIATSTEFVEKHWVYPSVSHRTVEKAIARTYEAILWRGADPGGLAGYAEAVINEKMKGWRLTLRTIAESEEFMKNIRPSKSDSEILNRMTEYFLGPNRPLGPQIQTFLLSLLAKGKSGDVAEVIGTSDEYFEELLGMQDDRPAPPPDFKVAFLGDQGLFQSSHDVLNLVRNEGAGLLVILGDFDYKGDPKGWAKMLDSTLGPTFPLLGIVGNHDTGRWALPEGYRKIFTERLKHMPGVECNGDYGVNSVCTYQNLYFVMSGIGTMGSGHESYLRNELPRTDHMWKICAWHKLQEKMQVGGKHDETGWPVYEICRENGAMVATAHEHSYSRTHLMSSFEKQEVASTSNTLQLESGRSFAFVSGLGGHSVRAQKLSGPWWASVHTSTQGGTHGVFFCTFNVDGYADKAKCYFKNVRGEVIDELTVIAPSTKRSPQN